VQIWQKNNDGAYILPPITMTADEGAEYSRIMSDIETYRKEMVLKFILGTEPLSNYDSFVNQIKSMNIDRAIELQQAALDRFNQR
jgi:putative aldouronate transport system substrate-binding protein